MLVPSAMLTVWLLKLLGNAGCAAALVMHSTPVNSANTTAKRLFIVDSNFEDQIRPKYWEALPREALKIFGLNDRCRTRCALTLSGPDAAGRATGRFGSEAAVARTEWVESDHRWAVAPVCIANAEPGGRHVPVRRLASPTAGNGSIRGRAARHSELDTENRTSRGEIRLEAAPVLVYRKFSIPKLDDVNPKLDEFRHQHQPARPSNM